MDRSAGGLPVAGLPPAGTPGPVPGGPAAPVGFLEREPEVYRFLLRGPARRSGDVGSFLQQVSQDVAVVLGEQLRAGGLDSGAAEPWAHGIVGLVHAAGDWWIDRRSMPRARLVEYVTSLLWSGMSVIDRTEAHP